MRIALRSIRASGQTVELIEHLLEDTSWATIKELEGVVKRVKTSYHAKRILRAFSVPSKTLMSFRLCIQQGAFPEIKAKIKTFKREEKTIIFNAEWEVDRNVHSTAVALYDDQNFCFGLRPYHTGSLHLRHADILKIKYTLEMNNGLV